MFLFCVSGVVVPQPRTIDRLWISRVRGFFGFRITVGFLFLVLSLGSSESVGV